MGVWFHEEKKPRKRPDWLAPGIWPRTTALFITRLFGVEYRFAVTPETRPFVDLILGKEDPWESLSASQKRTEFRRSDLAERGIMEIISVLLCQVQETAVDQAAETLAQEIKEKLEPLLAAKIRLNIKEQEQLPRLESGAGTEV